MKRWCAAIVALPLLLAGCQAGGQLGGTSWTVLSVMSVETTDIVDMDIDFGTNGMVTTTTTRADGSTETTRRHFSVQGPLLTVKRPEGDLAALHRIDGEEMILTSERFQARLLRLN